MTPRRIFLSGMSALALAAAAAGMDARGSTEVDASFGTNGTQQVGGAVRSVTNVPDGRMYLGVEARTHYKGQIWSNAAAARLLPNGTRDSPASVAYPAPAFMACAWTYGGHVAAQPDGKLLLAAYRCGTGVARFNADGTLDTAFGNGGWIEVAPFAYGIPVDIALHADGRITVAYSGGIYRFTTTGQVDTSYGNAGLAAVPGGGVVKTALAPDDRLVVLTKSSNCSSTSCTSSVLRLNLDGSLDATFNASIPTATPTDVGVLPDGAVIVGVNTTQDSGTFASLGRLYRFTSSGAHDSSFGTGGTATMLHAGGLWAMAIEPGGSVVGLGSSLKVMRWRADGSPEGRVWGILPSYLPAAILRQPDGKLVVAGSYTLPTTDGWTYPEASQVYRYGAGTMDMFADSRLFAAQQYRDFLEREGDPGGVTHWAGQLDSGAMTRAQLVQTYFNSEEFQGSFAPIARLYLAYFLRTPDYGGLQYWIDYYRSGHTLAQISFEFSRSPEFDLQYGKLDNPSFVNRVYNNVLGRNADPGGLQYWTEQLHSGAMNRGQVMLAFSESPEFRGTSASEVFVTMIYVGMLRRAADNAGFMFWVNQLDQGASGLTLIQGFLDSQEYKNRFLP